MPNTREKLIELLEQSLIHKETSREMRFTGVDTPVIANGVTVQKWIPVTERLPEDDLPKDTDRKQIRCLVATDKGTVKPCVRQRYQKKINGQWRLSPWEWNKDVFAKPTHWMPLPEPPKGD